MSDGTRHTTWRAWLKFPFDNWPSRVYLLLVVAAVLFFAADRAFVDHPDASFAGIYMILLTVPISLFATVPFVGIVIGALVNAMIIGALTHLVRFRHQRPG